MQHAIRTMSFYVVAIFVLALATLAQADPIWPAATTPEQINVTADSTPGWLPSQQQTAEMRKTAADFLGARDGGRPAEAYALLAEINQKAQPLPDYSAGLVKFNQQAGPVIERRIVRVTWTKDPAQAPAPGVYAALDIVSRYQDIDRDCGFIILYQAISGAPFRIMREETNVLDNVTAQQIQRQHSKADVDAVWARLSANCPNYPAEPPPPLAEQPQSTVGYPTVAAALQALHANAAVEFSSRAGWIVASDKSDATIWSFPPSGDPAYPAAVKRTVVSQGFGSEIQTTVLCESTKLACDNLVRQFTQLNAMAKGASPQK